MLAKKAPKHFMPLAFYRRVRYSENKAGGIEEMRPAGMTSTIAEFRVWEDSKA